MKKIFKLAGILILTLAVLSGCVLLDYGIGRRPIAQYRGKNYDDRAPANDGDTPYKSQRKGNWEAEYTDGKYKTTQKGNWETEFIEGEEGAGDDGEDDCDSEKYTYTPPFSDDYMGIGAECIRLCSRRQDTCKDNLRMKKESCEHFNAMAQIEFGRCLASGALNCYRSTHDCSEGDDEATTKCEEAYRNCYTNCGGTVYNDCD